MDYEWDDREAERNLRVHRVPFAFALKVFDDPMRLELLDDREDHEEDRWITIGYAGDRLLFVEHTPRADATVTRLISARLVTKREADEYHENLGR